jgi:hypothetical protein
MGRVVSSIQSLRFAPGVGARARLTSRLTPFRGLAQTNAESERSERCETKRPASRSLGRVVSGRHAGSDPRLAAAGLPSQREGVGRGDGIPPDTYHAPPVRPCRGNDQPVSKPNGPGLEDQVGDGRSGMSSHGSAREQAERADLKVFRAAARATPLVHVRGVRRMRRVSVDHWIGDH